MQIPTPTRSVFPAALLVLAAASWGAAGVLSKVALQQVTPIDLFGSEVTVGLLGITAMAAARGIRIRPEHLHPKWLALGLLEPGLAFVLFDVGLDHTSAGHASLLLGTEVLATVGLAAVFLAERPRPVLWLAVAAGIAGSVLVSSRSGGATSSVLGDLLVVASALASGAYVVLARDSAPGRDPILVIAVQMIGALCVAGPLTIASIAGGDSRLADVDAAHLAALVAVGMLGIVIPFALFTVAISRVTAGFSGIVGSLVSVFGVAGAVVFLGDTLTATQKLGGLLVIGATSIAVAGQESLCPRRCATA